MSPHRTPTATPDERAIRDALRATLISARPNSKSWLIIEELGIRRGQVRVDLALIDDLLHGYEIKSDRDNLRRLVRQVDFYGSVFDRATLVIGNRRLTDATAALPSWWGITRFTTERDGIVFHRIRPSRPNPTRVPRALVELLWRDEVLDLLSERDLDVGVRSKPRPELWDRVCSYFDLNEIANAVRARLMARKDASFLPSPS